MLLNTSSKRCGYSSGVERNLAKVDVVGPNPIARSNFNKPPENGGFFILVVIFGGRVMAKVKTGKDLRFEREAKALQKNLAKRKKQQAEREKLKRTKELKNGQD